MEGIRQLTIVYKFLASNNLVVMRWEDRTGHILNGMVFISLGVWWTWNISCKYFASRVTNKDHPPPYVNEVSPRALTRKPIVSIALIVAIILLDMDDYRRSTVGFTRPLSFMAYLHLTMESILLLYCFAGNIFMCSYKETITLVSIL